jgi:hypothetical protein
MTSADTSTAQPDTHPPADQRAIDTYRYLRGGMVVLIVLLTVAVLTYKRTDDCWATSISAYYFTPVRAVFVGSLCALGIMLIVYRGTKVTEDVLLDLAGLMAFVIAFVPTGRPTAGCIFEVPPAYRVLVEDPFLWQSVRNNVTALFIGVVVAKLLAVGMHWLKGTKPDRSVGGWIVTAALWLIFAVGLVVFVKRPLSFYDHAHQYAALILFVALVLVIAINGFLGFSTAERFRRYPLAYFVIALTMLVFLIFVAVLFCLGKADGSGGRPYLTLIVEAGLIGSFAAYWGIQTFELWETPTRPVQPPTTPAGQKLMDFL